MSIKEIISPTKSKIIVTISLFLFGIMFQLFLALTFVSFNFSAFGTMAVIVLPFMSVFFWPVIVLLDLVTQEWWIAVVYIINLFYLYFLACLLHAIYFAFKNRKK